MGLLSARRVLIGRLPNGVCKVGLGPLVDRLGALLRVERGRIEYNQPRLLAAWVSIATLNDRSEKRSWFLSWAARSSSKTS